MSWGGYEVPTGPGSVSKKCKAAGHALSEHSACLPSAAFLFIQTFGLQRENSVTEPLHKPARNQGKYRMEKKTNKKESININRDKIDLKKKNRGTKKKKLFFFLSAGSYSS